MKLSVISRAEGRCPLFRMRCTAAGGQRELRKAGAERAEGFRMGMIRRMARVTMPSIPSEPMKRSPRSKPVLFL